MKRTGIKFLLLTGVFIFISCALVNAATINWAPTDPVFRYSVDKIGGLVLNQATMKIGTSTDNNDFINNTNGVVTDTKNVSKNMNSVGGAGVNVTLNAGASGSFDSGNNSIQARAYAHYDLNDLTGSTTKSVNLDIKVTSWVKSNFTVDGPGEFMLAGAFTDPTAFTQFHNSNYWKASYENEGGIVLTEMAMVGGAFGASLNTWSYGLSDFTSGTISELVALRNWDPIGETAVGYELKVGFTGATDSHVQNVNSAVGGWQGALDSDYILGTEGNPLELTAQLTSAAAVPVPGAFILLFSGLCALFGFRFTFIRKK
jgi:hypothetical protein